MYVIDLLAGRYENIDGVVSEFRLLCSGALYNGRVQTFEWEKSDAARKLLVRPFSLDVVSRPADEYPQELSMVFSAPEDVTVSAGNFTQIFPPDDNIAQDLAVLLTVFLRRLVTVYAKVRRMYPQKVGITGNIETFDVRLPIVSAGTNVSWKRKPVGIAWALGGVESVIDYNPLPLAIDPKTLSSKLQAILLMRHHETFLMAARLYWQAMRIIEEWPDLAYQLLVYCTETLANRVFGSYAPPREQLVAAKAAVAKQAGKYGLAKEQAEELAVLACAGMPWSFRKFQLFLRTARHSIGAPDDLFRFPSSFAPSATNFDDAIRNVYESRSAAAHHGKPYSASVALGTTATIPIAAMQELIAGTQAVPPVVWFERVVNAALNHYVDAETEFHQKVSLRAYEIYEERGKEHGHDLDDWLKAEKELG